MRLSRRYRRLVGTIPALRGAGIVETGRNAPVPAHETRAVRKDFRGFPEQAGVRPRTG